MKISILAIAINIHADIINRFLSYSEKMDVKIITENDGLFITKDNTGEYFNKCKALNYGLSKLIKDGYDAIIQTDIDMIFHPILINKSIEQLKLNKHVFCYCRNSDYDNLSWEKYNSLPLRMSGVGAWNGLLSKDWIRTGGYNEDLYGWGQEDDEMHDRINRLKIPKNIIKNIPLVHINHPRRTQSRIELNKQTRIRTKYNKNFLSKYLEK